MKRVIGFLVVAVFTACTCLSQIPDQLVYVDQNCEAILPDYTPDVIVSDNCDATTVTQFPTPGTLLAGDQPVVIVTITALDMVGNAVSLGFNALLIDTISPTIEAGPGLLSYNLDSFGKIQTLYHTGVVEAIDNMHDSIAVNSPEAYNPADTMHRTDNLVMISNLDARWSTGSFVNPEWHMFSADSAYMVDSLGMAWTTIVLEFVDTEDL